MSTEYVHVIYYLQEEYFVFNKHINCRHIAKHKVHYYEEKSTNSEINKRGTLKYYLPHGFLIFR